MRFFSRIRSFKKEYSNLYKSTRNSCVFIVIYILTSELPELFTFAGIIWSTIFNICLAIIANTLFCYYQMFLPQQLKREKFRSTILQSLKSIRLNMSMDIEALYKINHATSKNFEDMDANELGTLCRKGLDENGPRMKRTADSPDESNPQKYHLTHISILESLHESAISIKQECQQLLNLYSSVMETDESSFLIHLLGSRCLSLFETYFTFNKPLKGISFGFVDGSNPYLVDLQKDYLELLKLIQKFENQNIPR